jgi:hypothetical protein
MLTAVTSVSFPMLAAWVIISYLPSSRPSILARPLPRLRPTLRVWAAVIAILAIDFAINSVVSRHYPGLFVRMAICDTASILLSGFELMFCKPTPNVRDLWALGFAVGCLGSMTLISPVTGH